MIKEYAGRTPANYFKYTYLFKLCMYDFYFLHFLLKALISIVDVATISKILAEFQQKPIVSVLVSTLAVLVSY